MKMSSYKPITQPAKTVLLSARVEGNILLYVLAGLCVGWYIHI